MAHTSINTTQVKDFIGEQYAPFLFNSQVQQKSRFALALASAAEAPIENIRSQINRTNPRSRVLEITAPSGRDQSKQYRAFLSEILYRLGESPFRRGQESAIAAYLPKVLSARYDFVIIDHAEHMGAYSIDALRRDRGCPPVFLVAYDDRILETLIANEALLNRIFMLS
ncbi:MAG: hypothetical protein IH586_04300, partial [Anaerolineaceae bacterium]|nr:hypothetical protein [Anaerolineaceae bacterium]